MSRPPEAAKSVRSDSGRVTGEKDCQYRYRDVSGYKTSLVLFEGAVLEVPVKDQSETQYECRGHAERIRRHRGTPGSSYLGPWRPSNHQRWELPSRHRLSRVSRIGRLGELYSPGSPAENAIG